MTVNVYPWTPLKFRTVAEFGGALEALGSRLRSVSSTVSVVASDRGDDEIDMLSPLSPPTESVVNGVTQWGWSWGPEEALRVVTAVWEAHVAGHTWQTAPSPFYFVALGFVSSFMSRYGITILKS